MLDHRLVRLGRLPARIDARTLRLGAYLTGVPTLPPTPRERLWSKAVTPPFGMLCNDRLGCCAISAPGHAIQCWTAANGKEITVSDADIILTYSAVSGYRPNDPESDVGCVMLDVLKYLRKEGLAGHKIGAFVSVDPKNHAQLTAAMNLFGGVLYGINLPLSAQNQSTWDIPWWGARWKARSGSWGGHSTFTPDFSLTKKRIACVTWGEIQPMTLSFSDHYTDECYALLSPDWCDGSKLAPSGLDLAALKSDLAAVTK